MTTRKKLWLYTVFFFFFLLILLKSSEQIEILQSAVPRAPAQPHEVWATLWPERGRKMRAQDGQDAEKGGEKRVEEEKEDMMP